jgi:hypothetical protein
MPGFDTCQLLSKENHENGVVSPTRAKTLTLELFERGKINITHLATGINESKQSVHGWLKGNSNPRDESVWVRMASFLGLDEPVDSATLRLIRELAMNVLVTSDDSNLREQAAEVIRKISKEFSDNY